MFLYGITRSDISLQGTLDFNQLWNHKDQFHNDWVDFTRFCFTEVGPSTELCVRSNCDLLQSSGQKSFTAESNRTLDKAGISLALESQG